LRNQEISAALDRYWKATVDLDLDKAHEIYHDDVIVEFPQSGERIFGERNLYELRAHYPAKLSFKILRTRGKENLWITELIITYDGASSQCSIHYGVQGWEDCTRNSLLRRSFRTARVAISMGQESVTVNQSTKSQLENEHGQVSFIL
jgi:hypothetical protein